MKKRLSAFGKMAKAEATANLSFTKITPAIQKASALAYQASTPAFQSVKAPVVQSAKGVVFQAVRGVVMQSAPQAA